MFSRSSIAFALFTSGVYAQTCSDAGVLENPSSSPYGTGLFENCVDDSQFCQPDIAELGQGVQQTYTVACQCPEGQWFNSGTDQTNFPTLGCIACVGACTSCQVDDRPTEFEGHCVCDDGYVTNQEAPREPCVEDNSCPDACQSGCDDVCDAGFGCTAEEDAQDCDTTSGGSADGPDLSEGCTAACQNQYDAVNDAMALCAADDTTVIPYTDFVTCFNGDGAAACANDELPIPLEEGMTDENICQMLMADEICPDTECEDGCDGYCDEGGEDALCAPGTDTQDCEAQGPDDCGTDSNGDPIVNCEDGSCPDEIEGCSEDISMSEECAEACGLLWLDVVNALEACEADDTRSTVIPYAAYVTCFNGDGTAAAACANDELPIPQMEGMTDDNMCQLFDGADGSGSGGEPTGACALCWENELQLVLAACGCDSDGMNCDETITDTQGTLAAFQTCVQDAETAEEGSCGEDLQDILQTQDSEACAKAADAGSGDSFSGSGSDVSDGCNTACETEIMAVGQASSACEDDSNTVVPYSDFVTCFKAEAGAGGACASDELPLGDPSVNGLTDETFCQAIMSDGSNAGPTPASTPTPAPAPVTVNVVNTALTFQNVDEDDLDDIEADVADAANVAPEDVTATIRADPTRRRRAEGDVIVDIEIVVDDETAATNLETALESAPLEFPTLLASNPNATIPTEAPTVSTGTKTIVPDDGDNLESSAPLLAGSALVALFALF